jgi:acetyl-CoA synthetase
MPSYDALQAVSVDDPTWFWNRVADELGIRWHRKPATVLDETGGIAFPRWFPGGELNAAETLLAHSGIALIEEDEDLDVTEFSYEELAARVWSIAASLRRLDVTPGDRVGLIAEFGADGVAALIAIVAIGAVAVPMFSGFAPGAVAARLQHCGARALLLQDGIRHGGVVADKAHFVKEMNGLLPRLLIHSFRSIEPASGSGGDFTFVDSEAPAMICYTSGTTAAPKAAVHVHGGFLVRAAMEGHLSFNLEPGRRFIWPSDMGWVVAAWQIVFVLSVGATLVVLPGSPRYPPDRVLSAARRYSVYALGVSPSLVRGWQAQGLTVDPHPDLALVAASGEPLDLDSWRWLDRNLCEHRRPILNCSGGTEVGGAFFMPPLVEGNPATSVGKPALGIRPDVLDGDGKSCGPGVRGELVIRRPWPSMSRGLYAAQDRYLDSYWAKYPHVWAHGDWVSHDSAGHWFVHGRTDDVIKVAGRRIDPREVEATIAQLESVAEVAVVAVPDPIKGSRLRAAIVATAGISPSATEIQGHVERVLGKAYRPEEVVVLEGLPRTETGKLQRKQIRSLNG